MLDLTPTSRPRHGPFPSPSSTLISLDPLPSPPSLSSHYLAASALAAPVTLKSVVMMTCACFSVDCWWWWFWFVGINQYKSSWSWFLLEIFDDIDVYCMDEQDLWFDLSYTFHDIYVKIKIVGMLIDHHSIVTYGQNQWSHIFYIQCLIIR